MLTYQRAHELLIYDELSGILKRKKPKNSRQLIVGFVHVDSHGHKSIQCSIEHKKYYAHRVIWLMKTGIWPDVVDHINGDSIDNRWLNLRNVTNAESMKNGPKYKNNSSGINGVRKIKNKWLARIGNTAFLESHLYLGDDFFEACCRRKSAEIKLGYHKNHGVRQQGGSAH